MTGRYPPLSTAGRKSLGWTCSTVPSRKRTAISRSAVRAMTMPRAPRATRRRHTGPIAITAVTRSPTSYSGGSSKVVAGTGHLGDSVDIENSPPTDPRLRLVTRSLPAPRPPRSGPPGLSARRRSPMWTRPITSLTPHPRLLVHGLVHPRVTHRHQRQTHPRPSTRGRGCRPPLIRGSSAPPPGPFGLLMLDDQKPAQPAPGWGWWAQRLWRPTSGGGWWRPRCRDRALTAARTTQGLPARPGGQQAKLAALVATRACHPPPRPGRTAPRPSNGETPTAPTPRPPPGHNRSQHD